MGIRIEEYRFIEVVKDKLVVIAVTNFVRYDPLVIQIVDCTQIQLSALGCIDLSSCAGALIESFMTIIA